MKQSSRFLDIDGRDVSQRRTCFKFHQNQSIFWFSTKAVWPLLRDLTLSPAPRGRICDATYWCYGHTVYASFVMGYIAVLDSPSFTLRCIILKLWIQVGDRVLLKSSQPSKPPYVACAHNLESNYQRNWKVEVMARAHWYYRPQDMSRGESVSWDHGTSCSSQGSQDVPLDFSSLWGSTTSTSSTIGSEIISEEAITQACGKQIQLMGFDLDVRASMVDNATQDGGASW
ncbi:hypothetical protein POM88_023513 [Heracleum sosnowskyi]|uniref:BAH domain-containing protein n=1 Tax=Heracleum sosnowskyi TaxID=360622 RepID=A0AAD8IIF9_9APIA|nr:hypothetical protein POM88_023513 [Heracleum sosnowskyi]